MKKIFFTFFTILFVSFYNLSFSYNTLEIKLYYDKMYLKLEKTLSKQKVLDKLNLLDSKIRILVPKTSSKQKIEILAELSKLNKTKISSLEKELKSISYIEQLKNNWYKYLELSNTLEYTQNNVQYRFNFTKYYQVTDKNFEYFIKNKINNWYLVKYKNEYLLVSDYSIEKKYLFSELSGKFSNFQDSDKPYSLNAWVYYTYSYSNYLFFENINWLYLSDLSSNKIDFKTTLFVKNKDKYYFVNDYKKNRLVSGEIIKNILNTNDFLYYVADDNRYFPANYDDILKQIKSKTQEITSWLTTKEDKIKTIYTWIILNISYYENYKNSDEQIYSWILTFKNKLWVCDWYTKLFFYMLSFAWVDDIEIKRWYAFDSEDFPDYWHAWVRIWNLYYDPTFDDPVWWDSALDFFYYDLPKELIYTNRFNGIEIPKELSDLSFEQRKNLALKNLYNIYEKYENYSLMSKIKNRIFLWLWYDEDLTIEKLSNKIPYFEVDTNYTFLQNWIKKQIKSLNYYQINENNIEDVALNSKVSLENMILFKWNNKNWGYDYRLAYDVITN